MLCAEGATSEDVDQEAEHTDLLPGASFDHAGSHT